MIAIIGDEDILLMFKPFGAKIFAVSNTEQARAAIEDTVKQAFSIVYITQTWAEQLKELIHPQQDKIFPVFVVIPDQRSKGESTGLEKLKSAARRALGSDRLFEV
jgi:V/A-type H+-transporting ATPase subunit F